MSTNPFKPVTLSDIGKRLNLSKRAVSQALSERESTVKISAATRERVIKLAKELGYRHNTAARALTSGRTGLFGILCQQSPSHIVHEHLHEVTKAFERQGSTPIILQPTQSSHDHLRNALDTLADAHVDGVLLLRHSHIYDNRLVRSWLQRGKQMAAIGPQSLRSVMSFIFDRRQGFHLILEHLAERNCRDILVLCEAPVPFYQPAADKPAEYPVQDFPEHLRHLQLRTLSEEINAAIPGTGSDRPLHNYGYHAALKVIESGKLPHAFLCYADSTALGALRACSEMGLRVPHDVLITGHGNESTSSVGAVTITTVAPPIQRVADDAVNYLLRASREPTAPRPRNRLYPFELIPRLSTDLPAP